MIDFFRKRAAKRGLYPESNGFRQTFQHFRRLLDLNNRVLEKIAEAERILGGSYLFDTAFLERFIAEVCELTREVIYHLNSLSGGRYMALYERLEEIKSSLEDIVSGGSGPYGSRLVLDYGLINRDLDHLVGAKNANLADISNNFDIKTPDGFAVTVTAYYAFMEENGLFEKIERLLKQGLSNNQYRQALRALFREARIPKALEDAVQEALEGLFRRIGGPRPLAVRSSAVGEDSDRSFAGQFHSVLDVPPSEVLDAYKEVVISRFSPELFSYIGDKDDLRSHPVAVGVQKMIHPLVSGVSYSRNPSSRQSDEVVISAVAGLGEELVSGTENADRYTVERHHPFTITSSKLIERPLDQPLPDGRRPTELLENGLKRGSALIENGLIRQIAEITMLLEKAYGSPRDIEWAIDMEQEGQLVILQNRPLMVQEPEESVPANIEEALKRFPVLMEGLGHTAQLGIASGVVVHVDQDSDPDRFPVGAVAVARYASPQLSRILKKAGAIITDVGSPTGHLATIAREYRVPAILGAEKATSILKEGMEVTVDAGEKKVYEGVVKELLEVEARRNWEYLEEPEVKILRRILRWVAPLYMLDPEDKDFVPEKCRTIHDIIHFSHEKAVESIINRYSTTSDIKGERSLPLRVDLPIQIKIIDIGGGIEEAEDARKAHEEGVTPDQIRSRPFKALLSGLLREDAWDREPVPFGMKDLFSSMMRPASMLTNPPEYSGENLAIIAEDYCNLSLRLGYHFNVIDAFMTPEPSNNYIYFRFAGGFAEEAKRRRRAELISWILEALFFKTEIHRDIVIGKLKIVESQRMEVLLKRLGELIAFTRQLDVRMADEESVKAFFDRFLKLHQAEETG